MEDREFFDTLHRLWSVTSGAQDRYWRPESVDGGFAVYAENKDGDRVLVASGLSETDADFLCGIHGCLPDLVRRLNAALDEADRADRDRDERECLIAELSGKVRDGNSNRC